MLAGPLAGFARVAAAMRIMAGDAGERIALLETLALPHVFHLVRDMVILKIAVLMHPEMVLHLVARPKAEHLVAAIDGAGVALPAHVDKPVARQLGGRHDLLADGRSGMRPMVLHMFLPWSVAPLASDAQEKALGPIGAVRTLAMLKPGVVALQAAGGSRARKIAGVVGAGELLHAPLLLRLKPSPPPTPSACSRSRQRRPDRHCRRAHTPGRWLPAPRGVEWFVSPLRGSDLPVAKGRIPHGAAAQWRQAGQQTPAACAGHRQSSRPDNGEFPETPSAGLHGTCRRPRLPHNLDSHSPAAASAPGRWRPRETPAECGLPLPLADPFDGRQFLLGKTDRRPQPAMTSRTSTQASGKAGRRVTMPPPGMTTARLEGQENQPVFSPTYGACSPQVALLKADAASDCNLPVEGQQSGLRANRSLKTTAQAR